MAFSTIFSWLIKKRVHQIELFKQFPIETQQELLSNLLRRAALTEWGKRYDFTSMKSSKEFTDAVPLQDYETLKMDIHRTMEGEKDILWPGEVKWFAKSSGTTNDRSKSIPVTEETLEECHFKGGKDLLGLHVYHHPKSRIYQGKTLAIGGSSQLNALREDSYSGDLSAIIIKNLPLWVEFKRIPGRDIALNDNWEEKMEQMARYSMDTDVTVLSGVPSWTLVLINRILELKQTDNLMDVWPNLELFMHGGVDFRPYVSQFKERIPGKKTFYLQTYNASEGFFGLQDRPFAEDMLLMLDYGIFYEFIPLEESHKEQPETIGLEDIELDTQYELVISTNSGLWRYRIGDTICFTSKNPYRIKVTGRTKQFLNVFGEELMVDNVEKALALVNERMGTQVAEYSVAPIFMEGGKNGGHEWVIEFLRPPLSLQTFTEDLDKTLREINSDYDAKRVNDFNLRMPVINCVRTGTFYEWMKTKGKLGGQHKVPRLSNSRIHIEALLAFKKTPLLE